MRVKTYYLFSASRAFGDDPRVRVLTDVVTELSAAQQVVVACKSKEKISLQLVRTRSGRVIRFQRLLIATGARPKVRAMGSFLGLGKNSLVVI